MGNFVNPGNDAFQATLNAKIYVDKSDCLIIPIVFWRLQMLIYVIAVQDVLENQLRPICLRLITAEVVILKKCFHN